MDTKSAKDRDPLLRSILGAAERKQVGREFGTPSDTLVIELSDATIPLQDTNSMSLWDVALSTRSGDCYPEDRVDHTRSQPPSGPRKGGRSGPGRRW